MLNFVECFFSICGDDRVVFVFLFVDVVDDVDGFSNVPSLHPWDESHLVVVVRAGPLARAPFWG